MISNDVFLNKRHKKCIKLHGVYVSSVADPGRTKKKNKKKTCNALIRTQLTESERNGP